MGSSNYQQFSGGGEENSPASYDSQSGYWQRLTRVFGDNLQSSSRLNLTVLNHGVRTSLAMPVALDPSVGANVAGEGGEHPRSQSHPQQQLTVDASQADSRKPSVRQYCRVNVSGLKTTQGEITDLSPTGLRLRVRRFRPWKPGEIIKLAILAQDGEWSGDLTARVIWSRRSALLLVCEAGVELDADSRLTAEQFLALSTQYQPMTQRQSTATTTTASATATNHASQNLDQAAA